MAVVEAVLVLVTEEDCWGGSNLGSNFPTPKEILDKFVIGQERAKKVNMMRLFVLLLDD